jgi:two-component system NarL family sensor kinase
MGTLTDERRARAARSCSRSPREITDGGEQFTRDDRAAVTERFGQGLGLATMEERVRGVGGRFHVRARPGAGTHVHAYVPLGTAKR